MNYKHYFVDLDDTIFDFQKSSIISFEKTMAEVGVQTSWQDVFLTFKDVSRKLWSDYEKGLVDRMKVRYERFIQTFERHNIELDAISASKVYLDQLCENVCYVEDSLELLERIKDKGHSLGLVTNGVAYVQKRRLNNSPDYKSLIDYMVVSEECEGPKPHPSMFQKAFEHCGANDKSEIIMLGDSLSSDIQGANNFGIDSCWYNPDGKSSEGLNPQYTIQNLKDFYQYI